MLKITQRYIDTDTQKIGKQILEEFIEENTPLEKNTSLHLILFLDDKYTYIVFNDTNTLSLGIAGSFDLIGLQKQVKDIEINTLSFQEYINKNYNIFLFKITQEENDNIKSIDSISILNFEQEIMLIDTKNRTAQEKKVLASLGDLYYTEVVTLEDFQKLEQEIQASK